MTSGYIGICGATCHSERDGRVSVCNPSNAGVFTEGREGDSCVMMFVIGLWRRVWRGRLSGMGGCGVGGL